MDPIASPRTRLAGALIGAALATAAALAAALAAPPATAAAQAVTGRVLDGEDRGEGIGGAIVALVDSTGAVVRRVLADSAGGFWIWAERPGTYRLTASRIGYAELGVPGLELERGVVHELEIVLRAEAVELEPVDVVVRREVRRFTVDEFYDRMARMTARGRGHFITRSDIENSNAQIASHLLRDAPGVLTEWAGSALSMNISLISYGKVCAPAILLDGRPLPGGATLDEWITVDNIEGIEVYRGYFQPDTYRGTWGCGLIMVWTRPNHSGPRFTWTRTFFFLGLVGVIAYGIPALLF